MAAPLGNHNHRKHGMSGTRLHRIWKTMNQRCTNPRCNTYKNYGAKGISVCDSWKNFSEFLNWSIDHGYREDLTLDRIDPKGDYRPDNCRWATQKVQQNNRTNNKYLELNGEEHTLSEWADITGIRRATIWARIEKYGWSIEKALTTFN